MDQKYMKRALTLARRFEGRTSPNPQVGAVLVLGGKIVGEGFHRGPGHPHGEVVALNMAEKIDGAKGADLYVTLEPCSHQGRTPPCTDAIVKAGIKRVFVGAYDPNPDVQGGGAKILERSNIPVSFVGLGTKIEKFYEAYTKFVTKKEPFVTLKAAMTLDGKIAASTGDSKWITSEKSRRFVHGIRARSDAVLVGIGTVIADDPELTVRLTKGKNPIKVIIDPKLAIEKSAKVFTKGGADVIIATFERADSDKVKRLEEMGVVVLSFSRGKGGSEIDLQCLMGELAKRNIMSILVEGGAKIFTNFIKHDIFDKVICIYSPKILTGSDSLGLTTGIGPKKIADAINLYDVNVRRIGEDIAVTGYRPGRI
jgi:diaminohydroxyphosphoribosylaminopyrimidine deaminase / 5-amino-6-(5-phosphoribosylamino)uracil reductase